MRRFLRRLLLVALALFLAVAGMAYWSWSSGGKSLNPSVPDRDLPASFRTWPEHHKIYQANDEPYVVAHDPGPSSAAVRKGALCYFGTFHTADRDHAHLVKLRERWQLFRPTIALCEGRSRGHFTRWPLSLLSHGEPAIVHELARNDGIPVHSLEPPYDEEVRALLVGSTKQRVGLYFALRVYWSEANGIANEALFLDLLRKRTNVVGLRGAFADLAAVDATWQPLLAEHGDWRTRKVEPAKTWIAAMSDRSRIVRGEHMIRLLLDLVDRGERVLAVVGRSHVIRHEPVLKAALVR